MRTPRPRHRRRWTTVALGAVLALFGGVFALSPASHGQEPTVERNPVVFVHGYTGSASNWTSFMAEFRGEGYSGDELHAFDYNWRQSNETSAEELSEYVDGVLEESGAERVDIVNHSMGGLVSQYYLTQLDGHQKVGHLASLAGANHGTTSASACTVYESCREMVPSSDFIERITAGDETPGETSYGTWYSACDGVIIPHTSTELEGAENNNAGCVTHLGFLTDGTVQSEVLDFLAG